MSVCSFIKRKLIVLCLDWYEFKYIIKFGLDQVLNNMDVSFSSFNETWTETF